DRVLDQRAVDDREHLLGNRLGGRQEPRSQSSDREHGLADALAHVLRACLAGNATTVPLPSRSGIATSGRNSGSASRSSLASSAVSNVATASRMREIAGSSFSRETERASAWRILGCTVGR